MKPPETGQALTLRRFRAEDTGDVVDLWLSCDLVRPSNDPWKDIERKQKVGGDLFLVATLSDKIVGSVMAGYEGHRGWINYLAVDPVHRRRGIGRRLMEEAERLLLAAGCPKINLQVRSSNLQVVAFYKAIGFVQDEVISLGKRLVQDGSVSTRDRRPRPAAPC